MKDLSFFLLKNVLGANMTKGFNHFCNGDGSNSTLYQQKMGQGLAYIDSPHLDGATSRGRQPTVEEMILQLELEEAASRRAKLEESGKHRMSSVNSSDILRSARNALNQYPRFSLDGKDAMYRSSFRHMVPLSKDARNSLSCNQGSTKGLCTDGFDSEVQKLRELPSTIAGESVVWCRPGLVAKLMGLEAMPIPVQRCQRVDHDLNASLKRQHLRRRAGKLNEIERIRLELDMDGRTAIRRGMTAGSCSNSTKGYCVMRSSGVELQLPNEQFGWPMRRLRQNGTSS